MDFDERITLNVLEGKTTYTNDYRKYRYDALKIFDWPNDRAELPEKPKPEAISKNIETFQPWYKGKHIKFDLLWQPKDIVRTNPFHTYENKEIVTSKEVIEEVPVKVESKKCLTPAINIDEIKDKDDRELLIKFMYTTEFKQAMEESSGLFKSRPAPKYSDLANFIICKKNKIIPEVPEDKIEKIKEFDKKQIRAIVEPTEMFWNNHSEFEESYKCPVKEVPQDVKDKIKVLIAKDELRLPYDYAKPGYEGYRPRLAKGVTLEKGDKPVTHPRMTVSQALTKRYADDMK